MMNPPLSLVGTWASQPAGFSSSDATPEWKWHVIDGCTCVYEHRTEMGMMIAWFQYWPHEDGILRYPLGKTARSLWAAAEYVPIALEASHLTMHEYRFDRVAKLPIPDRFDVFPGTRPDENGSPIPHSFRTKVQEYLPEPPKEAERVIGR